MESKRNLTIEVIASRKSVYKETLSVPDDLPRFRVLSFVTDAIVERADKLTMGDELAVTWEDKDGIGTGLELSIKELVRGVSKEDRLSAIIATNDMRVTVPI